MPISRPITPLTTGDALKIKAMMSRRCSPPPASSSSGNIDMGFLGSYSCEGDRETTTTARRPRSRRRTPFNVYQTEGILDTGATSAKALRDGRRLARISLGVRWLARGTPPDIPEHPRDMHDFTKRLH